MCHLRIGPQGAGSVPTSIALISHEPTHGEPCDYSTDDALGHITRRVSQSLDAARGGVAQSIHNLFDHLCPLVAVTAARWQSPHDHASCGPFEQQICRASAHRPALPLRTAGLRNIAVVCIVSMLDVHPNPVTYFCDDAGSYKAVENSACGI
jgi:hypothetical protein